MCRRRNPRIAELEAVLRVPAFGLGRKSCFVQGSVQKVAGTISGKYTSCTVSTMGSRGQAKNQQSRRDVTEGRNGFAPVFPIDVCPAFRRCDFPAVPDQTRAAFALCYLPVQRDKVWGAEFTRLWRLGGGH